MDGYCTAILGKQYNLMYEGYEDPGLSTRDNLTEFISQA